MERYIPNLKNGKTLKDDGVYSQARSNVIVPESDWTNEIKENVITDISLTLSDDLRKEIVDIAKNVDYKRYYDLEMYDLNDSIVAKLKKVFGIFEEINSFTILRLSKNSNIWPHADPNRSVNIYVPLYPKGAYYAPLEIYHNNKIYGVKENTNKTYIWNTQKLHCVINNTEYDRYNLQMSVYIPYKEFYMKYKDLIND